MISDEKIKEMLRGIDPDIITWKDGAELEWKDIRAIYEQGRADQRGSDAGVCDAIGEKAWGLYKRGYGPERADPHYQGIADGAGDCSTAIRANTGDITP